MDFETFKRAVDSMVGFQGKQGIGFMGGENLYHPDFERFALYAADKLTPEKLGLWSCFPEFSTEKMLHLGEVISDCFGTVFVNDHSIDTVIHAPFLVSIQECVDKKDMWYLVEHCWAWASWSASINPKGAYFCEIAAAMAMLFDDGETAWPVEPDWWLRVPKDYVAQMEKWCPLCGGAIPLKRRCSTEIIDDVSPGMLERLKQIDSPKIRRGEYEVSDLQLCADNRQMASYKDEFYRKRIASRYGLVLILNEQGFMAPFKKIVGNLETI
jgi:hypothetical protein